MYDSLANKQFKNRINTVNKEVGFEFTDTGITEGLDGTVDYYPEELAKKVGHQGVMQALETLVPKLKESAQLWKKLEANIIRLKSMGVLDERASDVIGALKTSLEHDLVINDKIKEYFNDYIMTKVR